MSVSTEEGKRYEPLCPSVTTEEIDQVLISVFYRDVASRYSTREAFSALLDWMPVIAPWKREYVVLLHRLEVGRTVRSPQRSPRELRTLLGQPQATIVQYGSCTYSFSYCSVLQEAHSLMGGDPACITEGNAFRRLGIGFAVWSSLARAGIRTLDQLQAYSPRRLEREVPGMGAKRIEEIKKALRGRLALKVE